MLILQRLVFFLADWHFDAGESRTAAGDDVWGRAVVLVEFSPEGYAAAVALLQAGVEPWEVVPFVDQCVGPVVGD